MKPETIVWREAVKNAKMLIDRGVECLERNELKTGLQDLFEGCWRLFVCLELMRGGRKHMPKLSAKVAGRWVGVRDGFVEVIRHAGK